MERRGTRRAMVALGIIVGLVLSVAASAYGILQFGFLDLMDFDRDVDPDRPIETGLENLDVDASIKGGFSVPVYQQSGIKNYLLIGVDARGDDFGGRSDAMMILTINNKTKKFNITSLMRGMYVSIPNEPDPGMERHLSTQYMLNAAHTWGGARLLSRTVERNFRVKLDGYFQINFAGFEAAIDRMGGVRIELSNAEANHINGQVRGNLSAGMQNLNGEQALAYARIRKLDNDFERTGRQRNVIESVLSQGLSGNPQRAIELAQAILPLMRTNVSQGELMSHILGLPGYANYKIEQLMLPIDDSAEIMYVNGQEMWRTDFAKNVAALHRFMSE